MAHTRDEIESWTEAVFERCAILNLAADDADDAAELPRQEF
jgi:hypothetical protein